MIDLNILLPVEFFKHRKHTKQQAWGRDGGGGGGGGGSGREPPIIWL